MSITPEEVAELASAIPVGSWSHSPSTGSPQTGGFQAQVWDAKGASVLWLEIPLGPEADALAAFIAAAPDMAALIAEQAKELELLREYAALYKWIREEARSYWHGNNLLEYVSDGCETLDDAIRNAIRQQGGKVGG